MRSPLAFAAIAVLAAACSDPAGPDSSIAPQFAANGESGDVYTASNALSGNEVLRYTRAGDGSLSFAAAYATNGTGTGAGLGNQGGLVASGNGRWLLVVNAGSNSVSVFARNAKGSLQWTDTEASGGTVPISIALHERIVYVLNAGGAGNISGFTLSTSGELSPIAGSMQPLSGNGVGPAQIGFSKNGDHLVVTEKGTSQITTYAVNRTSGVAGAPVVNPSAGVTPFGFAIDNTGLLIVSNAAGGGAGAGSLSAYAIRDDGSLEVRANQVANFQSAPCWVALSRNSRFAYTTNTGSNTTTGYGIGSHGQLTLLEPGGVSGANTGAPIDAATTRNGREFLYVLNGAGAIDAFRVGPRGTLENIPGGVAGLPSGTNGLVAM